MITVNPTVEIVIQKNGLNGIYDAIANAARICYASEKTDKCKEMVERLISLKHFRPLEFGTVYLIAPHSEKEMLSFYTRNTWSYALLDDDGIYITTNYRVIIENKLEDHLKYLHDFVPGKHKARYTIKWTNITRPTGDSFRTHCSLSSLMQSTRYCNYSLDRFNNAIMCPEVYWLSDPNISQSCKEYYLESLALAEKRYMTLCQDFGLAAENARGVLPFDVKTIMIQCGYSEAWDNFFNLRYYGLTGKPHGDAKLIAGKALKLYESEKSRCTNRDNS